MEFIFFRRQFLVIIFCALLAVTDGLIRSSTAVILDARRGQFFQQQSIPGDASADMAWVESQVEILKSENIANSVIKAEICRQQRQSVGSGTGFVGAGHVAKVRVVRQHIRRESWKLCGANYVFRELDAKLQLTQLASL